MVPKKKKPGRPKTAIYPRLYIGEHNNYGQQFECRIALSAKEPITVCYKKSRQEAKEVGKGIIVYGDIKATKKNIDLYRKDRELFRKKDKERKSNMRLAIGNLVDYVGTVDESEIKSISICVETEKLHKKLIKL